MLCIPGAKLVGIVCFKENSADAGHSCHVLQCESDRPDQSIMIRGCHRGAPLPSRMKIRMCDAMMTGTRNVGNRPNGKVRKGAIDVQSCRPMRNALLTTKM